MRRVAVVGSGLAGLTVARALEDVVPVVVFDKSSGVGGRMSTRRSGSLVFDHGAQYFTARTVEFRKFLAPWLESGVVGPWRPRLTTLGPGRDPYRRFWFEPHYVAIPGMTSWCKDLASPVEVVLSTAISELEKAGSRWLLVDSAGIRHGPFDLVVSAVPAPQAAVLLPQEFCHRSQIDDAVMSGCYTLMLALSRHPGCSWDAAVVLDAPIGWIAFSDSRPGREPHPAMVVHSTNAWAERHLEQPIETVRDLLLEQFFSLTGFDEDAVADATCHRWRYAATSRSPGCGHLLDAERGLAAVGDWCIEGRVEAAYLSGRGLADALLALV